MSRDRHHRGMTDATLSRASEFSRGSLVIRAMQRLGLLQRRSMFWWWDRPINFGDWIGPLIYEWRTGVRPFFRSVGGQVRGRYFVSVGSILHLGHKPRCAVVWGSGSLSDRHPTCIPAAIHAVRGPGTRALLSRNGVKCPDIYGDPGILIDRILGGRRAEPEHDLGIIAHFHEADALPRELVAEPSVLKIDVARDVQAVHSDIARCRAVASSILHGLVVAHALGVPALWVRFKPGAHLSEFKFRDYFAGVGHGDTPAPVLVAGSVSARDLVSRALAAPRPDLFRPAERLLAACPF